MMECQSISLDIAPIAISSSDVKRAGCVIGDRLEKDIEGRLISIQVIHFGETQNAVPTAMGGDYKLREDRKDARSKKNTQQLIYGQRPANPFHLHLKLQYFGTTFSQGCNQMAR